MSSIVDVHAREILDSRGNPTVEVEVATETGDAVGPRCRPGRAPASTRRTSCATATRAASSARACSQCGRATSRRHRAEVVIGIDAVDQAGDRRGAASRSTARRTSRALGANAILGVSLATARAAAQDVGLPLYRYLGGVAARARCPCR